MKNWIEILRPVGDLEHTAKAGRLDSTAFIWSLIDFLRAVDTVSEIITNERRTLAQIFDDWSKGVESIQRPEEAMSRIARCAGRMACLIEARAPDMIIESEVIVIMKHAALASRILRNSKRSLRQIIEQRDDVMSRMTSHGLAEQN